jgi:hypothetical protein
MPLAIRSLVSSLHVPRGNHDTWNTPGEGYIDYCTLAVYQFTTFGVNNAHGYVKSNLAKHIAPKFFLSP